jgi:hypothetical protein
MKANYLNFWKRGSLSIFFVLAALTVKAQLLASWDFTSSTAPTSFLNTRITAHLEGYSGGGGALSGGSVSGSSFNSAQWNNRFAFGITTTTGTIIKINRIRFKIQHSGATNPAYRVFLYNAPSAATAGTEYGIATSFSTTLTQIDLAITPEYNSASNVFNCYVPIRQQPTGSSTARAYIDDVEFYGTIECANQPVFATPTTNPSCSSNGKINLAWTGGTNPYTINYTGAATGTTPSVSTTSTTINNLATGNYNLTITDANSCTATTTATVAADNSCRCSDSLQLISLYNATGGANWTNKWILTQPMTSWYGVSLNAIGCVTCIDLDGGVNCYNQGGVGGNNLVGTIPNLNLPNLEDISLGWNQLSGNIPNFSLPKLRYLMRIKS